MDLYNSRRFRKTKERTSKKRFFGILVPIKDEDSFTREEYQIILDSGDTYNLHAGQSWGKKLKLLGWSHVMLGGSLNEASRSINLLYIMKSSTSLNKDSLYKSYKNEEQDIEAIKRVIKKTGKIEPAA